MQPFVPAAAGFIFGIVAARLGIFPAGGLYFIAAFLPVAGWLLWKRKEGLVLTVICLCLAGGHIAYNLSVNSVTGNLAAVHGEEVILTGKVQGLPAYEENRTAFNLQLEGQHDGVVRVYLYRQDQRLYPGDRLRLKGKLYLPSPRRNPGGFDYESYLLSIGAGASLQVYSAPLSIEEGRGAAHWLAHTRDRLAQSISRYLPGRQGELLSSLILGRSVGVETQVEEDFRKAGISHLLAVSGLHVGLVAGLVLSLLSVAGLPRFRAAAFAIPAVMLYALLTGPSVSALRAAVMFTLALGAVALDRDQALWNALAIAALITLIWQPLQLFNPGFQLSYAAVIALFLFTPRLKFLRRFLPKPAADLAAATLAAQLGVVPLTAWHFGAFSLTATFANLIILPFMAIMVGTGLAAGLLGLMVPAFSYLAVADLPLLLFLERITALLADVPGGYLQVAPVPEWLFLYLPIILIPVWWGRQGSKTDRQNRDRRGIQLITVILAAALIGLSWNLAVTWSRREQLTVTFLDVGQGDAVHIQSPGGYDLLLDGGGALANPENSREVGIYTLLPYLRARGVDNLDLVLISHPHADHYGGLLPVMETYPVAGLAVNGDQGEGLYLQLLSMAENKGIPVVELREGDILQVGEQVRLQVISSARERWTANDNSLVLHLTYGQTTLLLTGDIEEQAIAALTEGSLPEADIIKLPHHGGYVEELELLIDGVSPRGAVISVGPNNYGHPAPATLMLLEQAGIKVFRTDKSGAVTLISDGTSWKINEYIR